MAVEIAIQVKGQADTAWIDQIRSKLEGLGPALDKAFDAGDLGKSLDALRDRFDALEREAKQSGDALEDAGRKADKSGGIFDGVLGKLAKLGLAAHGVQAIAGAVGSLGSAAGGLISANAEFERFETQLTTLMGSADAAKDRLAELADFGASTPFELPEIAAAEKVLIGFGLTGQRAIDLTGQSAAELRTIIGDVAAGTGVAFEEIAGTFGKFSAGATGEAISRLQELGIVTREQLAGMGVEFSKSGQLLSPLPEAMEAAVAIAGEKFGGGMDALSATFEGQMSTLADNVEMAKRTLAEPIFDALKDGLAGLNSLLASESVQSALQRIAALIGTELRAAIEWLKGAIAGIDWQAWSSRAQAAAVGLFLLRDAVVGVVRMIVENWRLLLAVGAGVAAGMAAAWVVSAATQVVAAATAAGGYVPLIAAQLAAAASAIAAAAPFIALGAVVAGVAYVLITRWDEVQVFFATVHNSIIGYVDGIKQVFSGLASADLGAAFEGWAQMIGSIFGADAEEKVLAFGESVAGLKDQVVGSLEELGSGAVEKVSGMWETITSTFTGAIGSIVAAVLGFRDSIQSTWEALRVAVSGIVQGLSDWLTSSWTSLVEYLVDLKHRLAEAIMSAWTWIQETVSSIVGRLTAWIAATFGRLGTWINGFLTRVMSVFGRAWGWIWKTVSKVATSIANAVIRVFHWMGSKLAALWDLVSDVFWKVWNSIRDIFVSAATPIINGVVGLFTKIAEIARDGMTAVGGIVGKVFEAIATKLEGFAGLLGPLGPKLLEITGKLRAGGAGLLDGIGEGLQGWIDKIKAGVGNVVGFFRGKIERARERVASLFGGGPEQTGDEGGAGDTGAPEDLGPGYEPLADTGGGSGGGSGSKGKKAKSAKKKEAKKTAEELAKTMADIAKKVGEAIKTGLEALRELMKTDIPGQEVWGPKLAQMETFITGALEAMQRIGTKLFDKVEDLGEGETLFDTKKAQSIETSAALMGDTIETFAKTGGFLQGLVRAKFPTAGQVEAVLGLIETTLESVRGKTETIVAKYADQAAIDKSKAVGEALAGWSELFFRTAEASVMLGESVEQAKAAPAAMDALDVIMDRIVGGAGRIVSSLQAVFPDETKREEALGLSERVAEVLGGWVAVVGAIGASARDLMDLPGIPAGFGAALERFFQDVGRAGGVLVAQLRSVIADHNAQLDALEVSEQTARVLTAWIAPVAALAKTARDLRFIARIPSDVTPALEAFWREVTRIAGSIYVELSKAIPDRVDQLEALAVSQALSASLAAAVEAVGKTADVIRTLDELPDVPEGALSRVESTMRAVSGFLAGMLRGPGYDLLADRERTLGDFAVVQALIKTLSDGVGLVSQVAGLGAQLAEALPIDPASVDRALENAAMVRDKVAGLAAEWLGALEEAGEWAEDVIEEIGTYGEALKAAIDVATGAAKLSIAEVVPLKPEDLETAMDNGLAVLTSVKAWAQGWHRALAFLGESVETVVAEIKTYAGVLKDALGAAEAAAKLSIAEVAPLDSGLLELAISNADIVLGRVKAWARGWHAALEEAEESAKAVGEEIKAYAAALKDALGLAEAAGKFGLDEVLPLDPGQLDLAMANAEMARAKVQALAKAWAAAIRDAGDTVEQVSGDVAAFSGAVKAAVDLIGAAGDLVLERVGAISIAAIEQAMANAIEVYRVVAREALAWAQAIREAGGTVEQVEADQGAFVKVAGGAIDLVGKVLDLMHAFQEQGSRVANVSEVMPLIKAQIVAIVRSFAEIFREVEAEAGTLKQALDASEVIGPAADALSKVFGALSLENLLKSPLVDTKLRSGFARGVANRRMDALKTQIVEGVRRTVAALVEGLQGIEVPDTLGDGLERVVAAYERIVALFERVRDLTTPDPAKIREIAAMAALLVASLPAGAGMIPGGTVTGPPPGSGDPLPPTTRVDVPGAPGAPVAGQRGGYQLPVDPGAPEVNATIRITSPVILDGEQIGAALERIIHQRNVGDTTRPSGG